MPKSVGTKKSAGPAETAKSVRSNPAKDGRDSVIPWGYGVDRVKAMAVDPERLYVYWEVTDESIERAREQLGTAGADAALVLRVYDTTGRIFDGTNAHDQIDHEVARGDRQWFFQVGKPSSEAIVEIGLLSREGGFVKIARSGRVEFPRRKAREPRSPEWLTVRLRDGDAQLSHENTRPVDAGFHAESIVPRFEGGPQTVASVPDRQSLAGEVGVETVPAWTERIPSQTLTEETRVFRREGDWTGSSWEAGPFTTEIEATGPWTESFVGGVRVYRHGPRTRVVDGPWEVVIRGLGAYRRRAVLARWEIHHSWITEEGREVCREVPTGGELLAGSSAGFGLGASERRWQGGSERRLAGASELLYLGASERRLGGASERSYLAASEWLVRGASERRLGGASERTLRGASERRLAGASERRLGGASDRRPGGASEKRPRTATSGAYPNVSDDNEAG